MGTTSTSQAVGTALASKTPYDHPKTVIDLTFPGHLSGATDLCLTLSLYKPRCIFSTLEAIFQMLVCCLPAIGLAKINPFPVSLCSPPLILSAKREPLNLVCLEPLESGAPTPKAAAIGGSQLRFQNHLT